MKKDFTQLFETIRNKFIEQQTGKSITMKALANFLGHEHDGKVTAWKKGQWPNAEDIAAIHDKLGFNYRWLLIGEGDPLAKDKAGNLAELKKENEFLKLDLAEEKSFSRKLSMQNAELYEECRALKEKLAFLEAGKTFAQSREAAPGSQAVRNMSGGSESQNKQ